MKSQVNIKNWAKGSCLKETDFLIKVYLTLTGIDNHFRFDILNLN